MNKLYYLLLALVLAAPLGVHAQQPDSLSLKLDAVFAHVDKMLPRSLRGAAS